jgi:hypothetical protein
MGTAGLDHAIRQGAPLVDVVVRFREGVNYTEATQCLNTLADDFDLLTRPWYDEPALRIGSATKEALERLFGWRLIRVSLERYFEETGQWGTWDDVYRWEEVSGPKRYPEPVADLIESIWISQPGSDDEGQWYE